jgi:hypothetical protein
MADTALNGRSVCILRNDPRKDINALADAIIAAAEIYNHNGSLVLLRDGKLVRVTAEVLREIIPTHVATRRLMDRDGRWALEYYPFECPTERALATLLRAENLEEGSLLARAPPA